MASRGRTRDNAHPDDVADPSNDATDRLFVDRARVADIERVRSTDPVAAWMSEVTLLVEQLTGRLKAVEKSVDGVVSEVRTATDTAKMAAAALTRIAKAEESQAQTARDRLEGDRLQDKNDRKNRDKWATRLWESPAVQMLLTGVVLAILQFLGVAYLATHLGGVSGK